MGSSFDEWLQVLLSDIDYYTGQDLAPGPPQYEKLSQGYRYAAAIPLVLGGEYNHKNLNIISAGDNLAFDADIERQIRDHPDGTNYVLKFKDEPPGEQ
jgi:hypothetical protein